MSNYPGSIALSASVDGWTHTARGLQWPEHPARHARRGITMNHRIHLKQAARLPKIGGPPLFRKDGDFEAFERGEVRL